MPPKIIGISGTNGSGKDTVGQLLMQRHNYLFVSASEILRQELRRQGLESARKNTRTLSAHWRREHGNGVLIDKALAIFEEQAGRFKGLAISSLRNPGEADRLHELGGQVLWIDADPRIRYRRVRGARRGSDRSADDNKTFTEFLADETTEMSHPEGGDAATLSMSGVKAKSDWFLSNNSDDINSLAAELDRLLGF